uniref:Uncharacterized protein n=1 Tax=Anguilla anguilla TaxID=7936 RepID=A0A0E9RFH3_ANGAN
MIEIDLESAVKILYSVEIENLSSVFNQVALMRLAGVKFHKQHSH